MDHTDKKPTVTTKARKREDARRSRLRELRVVAVTAGVLCAAVLLAAQADVAAPPLPRAAPASLGVSPAKLGEAGALLAQYVASHRIAGAVAAVARHGHVAWIEAVGFQDLAAHEAMTARSIFRIYSMTKSVTAVAAMILHEDGRFQLDDPV